MSEIKPIYEGDCDDFYGFSSSVEIVVLRAEDYESQQARIRELEELAREAVLAPKEIPSEKGVMPSEATISEGPQDNRSAARDVVTGASPSGANETGFVPPVCPTHKVQMVLSFYQRGPNDPPGNGWSCLECVEDRKTEAVETSESGVTKLPDCVCGHPFCVHGISFQLGAKSCASGLNTDSPCNCKEYEAGTPNRDSKPAESKPFTGPHWDAIELGKNCGDDPHASCIWDLRERLEGLVK